MISYVQPNYHKYRLSCIPQQWDSRSETYGGKGRGRRTWWPEESCTVNTYL